MAAGMQKKNSKKTSVTVTKTSSKKPVKKKTAGARTKNTANRAKAQTRTKQTRAATKKKKQTAVKNSQMRDEVLLWLVLAVSLIALLSNFGLGGFVGESVSSVLFGVFGTLAYAVPFLLFFLFAFLISNRRNKVVWVKILAAAIMLVVICGFFELIPNGYVDTRSLSDYYYDSASEKTGGGILGGLVGFICCPAIGIAGTFVVLFVLAIISFVLLTEKSLFAGIEKGSKKVYHSAKEESAHQRELWENRRRQYLMEREERNAARKQSWEEERQESHGVANIVLQGFDVEEEEKAEETIEEGDWLEIEAQRQKEERSKKKRREDSQPEGVGESILQKPELLDEEAQRQKNFWETQEEEEIPIPVQIEEIDLMEEQEHTPRKENIDEIFIPQCRMAEIGRSASEAEAEEEETDETGIEEISAQYMAQEEREEVRQTAEKRAGTPEQREEAFASSERSYKRKAEQEIAISRDMAQRKENIKEEAQQRKKEYQFPPLDLLNLPKGNKKVDNRQDLKETAIKLQQTLHSFGVNVHVIDASCGPSVTRYELQPEQGVKVSRIVNLADDIKLNLAAADIRIEAPIPGKAAVGIEVPNKENSVVLLRELLESGEFQNHPSNLAFAAGKDIGGKTVVADIAKMPHLLIAGATGSGKSVCINTIIISLLYKADPEEVKLIMIDPKVVELSVYNGIPHLMIPVVTDPKKAAGALNWAVSEMTERYNKFAVMGVRDLKGYNQKIASVEQIEDDDKPQKMPQIVIIVDELADLMMVAQNDVEDAICRLAQLARAAGIHLIIATQRPSVNVITGVIKANMPSRIAFSVSSGVDSRTIIDMNGAEKLLGKGDMLFFPQGLPKPTRVQGAFISDTEVSNVVEFLTAQNAPCYAKEIENKVNLSQIGQGGQDTGSNWDSYFEEAGKIVIEKDKASIGMLQRGLKIGFNRAARIMDQLCEAGVVGEEEGTKPRKVLMSMEAFEAYVDEYI